MLNHSLGTILKTHEPMIDGNSTNFHYENHIPMVDGNSPCSHFENHVLVVNDNSFDLSMVMCPYDPIINPRRNFASVLTPRVNSLGGVTALNMERRYQSRVEVSTR